MNLFTKWRLTGIEKKTPSSSAGKESACSAREPDLILGQEDPLEKG